ncbi:MAG: non-canonical purine NTP pyrophosphatase, partial [Actinobacteria bacterium]|nr:non-canonical purine NTP pyrophosphatase [Actinomycetota bacterium]
DNRSKLLAALRDVDTAQRTARFRTVALVAYPDGSERFAEGVCEGVISDRERGSRGFGYDSVFVPLDGDGRTFAEMSVDDKHALGHRGRAFRALAAAVRAN